MPSQLFLFVHIHTLIIPCSLSIQRSFSFCSSLVAFDEDFGKTPRASVVQQFSCQRDRIKKPGVPNWLHGLGRPKISWYFSLSDQQPFNSMVCAVANMTFKETQGLFLWFKEVISRQGFCFASEAVCTFSVACIKCFCKTTSWSFVEWWAEWIRNYHYQLCSSLRAGLGDHLIPVTTSQAVPTGPSLTLPCSV